MILCGIILGIVLFMAARPSELNLSFSTMLTTENVASRAMCNDREFANHTAGRYAYVFYASNDAYACSALVNMARLHKTLPENVDLVMIAFDSVSSAIRDVAVRRCVYVYASRIMF